MALVSPKPYTDRATGIGNGPIGEAHRHLQADQASKPPNDTREANVLRTKYKVTSSISRSKRGSLVDRGANGGILGSDAHVTHTHIDARVDVTGIDNHEMTSLKIVDATARTITNKGPVLLRLHRYAYHGRGRTIHSCGQIEAFGNTVHDRSLKVRNGGQCIVTSEGYVIPIDIISGLPYIQMEPNLPEDIGVLPEIVLTSPDKWDPSALDNIISDKEDWMNHLPDYAQGIEINRDSPFDEVGDCKKREVPSETRILRVGNEDDALEEEVCLSNVASNTPH